MLKLIVSTLLCFLLNAGCAQVPERRPQLENPAFDRKLTHLLDFSVPLISVQELKNIQHKVHIFDAREWTEYEVSHIPGAKYLGYNNFDKKKLSAIPKEDTIVLYCSVGYRSEKIGEKLRKMGYEKVYNLYGSIFEWVNADYPIVDAAGNPTTRLHTYNKNWSKWVTSDKAVKVW